MSFHEIQLPHSIKVKVKTRNKRLELKEWNYIPLQTAGERINVNSLGMSHAAKTCFIVTIKYAFNGIGSNLTWEGDTITVINVLLVFKVPTRSKLVGNKKFGCDTLIHDLLLNYVLSRILFLQIWFLNIEVHVFSVKNFNSHIQRCDYSSNGSFDIPQTIAHRSGENGMTYRILTQKKQPSSKSDPHIDIDWIINYPNMSDISLLDPSRSQSQTTIANSKRINRLKPIHPSTDRQTRKRHVCSRK